MNKKAVGVLAIVAASLLWAIEPILARLSYANSDFLHTTAIRSIFMALTALVYVKFFSKGSLKVGKKEFSVLASIALLATVVAELIYLYALSKIPIINVIVLGHTQPIFIALLGYFILKKDKLTIFDYSGILLMILASIMVTAGSISNITSLQFWSFVDLLVIFAAIIWAVTAILARKYLNHLDAGTIVFYRYAIAAFVFAVYLIAKSSFMISNIYQVLIGIVVGIGIILYYESIKRIKAAQAGALELTAPFFAAVLGFLFFRETVNFFQVAGMVVMLAGVHLLSKRED